jgi:RNase H-like domain found in reverse transcriptase
LSNLPILVYPDESEGAGEFIIQTDASVHSIAGIIMQRSRDGLSENLIACYGRKLRPNEQMWDSNQKEVLALIICVIKYRHLVAGRKLIVRSDNLSVRYFATLKNASAPRSIRWSIYLSDILCNATFEHVKGTLNSVADALSRRVYIPEEEPPTERELDIVHDDLTISVLQVDIADAVTINSLHIELYQELDEEEEDINDSENW